MKQFIVAGLGRFGSSLATTLTNKGHNVLAIDKNKERVQKLSNLVTHAVEADISNKSEITNLGISNFDVAIVCIGNDIQVKVLATIIFRELGVPYIVAKAEDKLQGNVLTKVGADKVVYPERDMGMKIANNLMSPNVFDYIELSSNYSIMELPVSDFMVDQTLSNMNFRSKYNVNVVAIKRDNNINLSPGAEDHLQKDDSLIIIGRNEDIMKMNL